MQWRWTKKHCSEREMPFNLVYMRSKKSKWSLVGCSPWGHRESDDWVTTTFTFTWLRKIRKGCRPWCRTVDISHKRIKGEILQYAWCCKVQENCIRNQELMPWVWAMFDHGCEEAFFPREVGSPCKRYRVRVPDGGCLQDNGLWKGRAFYSPGPELVTFLWRC